MEPSQIFKILFSYPGAFSPISGYVGPICPFTIDQSTELLNLIIHDVNGCIKAFYDFNVYSPLFSVILIVKNRILMELITIKAPLNNQRIVPLDYTRLLSVWGELYQTNDPIFVQLFYAMGEKVIMQMITEKTMQKNEKKNTNNYNF